MIREITKTRTGYKLKIAAVTDRDKICNLVILCSHTPNQTEAAERAKKHVATKLLNFKRFANEEDFKTLNTIIP